MRRKGSFLRRHFANPRGPVQDDRGQPTRLALSAHAWGEPIPKTMAAAARLAVKGARLLERYAKAKGKSEAERDVAAKRKNSLVANINARKKAGESRPKSRSTISSDAYSQMEHGWPKKAGKSRAKRAKKKSS